MGGGLATTDLRPFFFRAIESGKKEGVLTAQDLERIRREGAEMTIHLAKRHYSLTNQAYLWQATYNLCGVISLALAREFGSDISAAAYFLKRNDLVQVFRQGWKSFSSLVELKKEIFEEYPGLEKDLCEDFSAEPDSDWPGLQDFEKRFQETRNLKRKKEYQDWLISQYCQKPNEDLEYWEKEDPIANKAENPFIWETRKAIVNTFFISLLISETPFAPLDLKDLEKIIKKMDQKDSGRILKGQRADNFFQAIPERWRNFWKEDFESFQDFFSELRKNLKKKGVTWVSQKIQSDFFVDIDIQEVPFFQEDFNS